MKLLTRPWRDISFHLFLDGVRVSDALYPLAAFYCAKFTTLLLVKCKTIMVGLCVRRPVPEAAVRPKVHVATVEKSLRSRDKQLGR